MTKAGMLRMLRLHLNDDQKVGWEFDEELVDFLDRATDFITNLLIRMKHNYMIKPVTINGETTLPDDFISFVGRLPIRVFGNKAKAYGSLDNAPQFDDTWGSPNHQRNVQSSVWGGKMDAPSTPSYDELQKTNEFQVYYWSRLPYISSLVDTAIIPYPADIAGQVIEVARMLALNKNEYDIAQDVTMFEQVQTALSAVTRGDEQ
jgi:hypothetical protein